MPRPKIAEKSTSLTLKVDSDLYELMSWIAKFENKSVAALARESLEVGWRELCNQGRLEKAQADAYKRIKEISEKIPSPSSMN